MPSDEILGDIHHAAAHRAFSNVAEPAQRFALPPVLGLDLGMVREQQFVRILRRNARTPEVIMYVRAMLWLGYCAGRMVLYS